MKLEELFKAATLTEAHMGTVEFAKVSESEKIKILWQWAQEAGKSSFQEWPKSMDLKEWKKYLEVYVASSAKLADAYSSGYKNGYNAAPKKKD